MRFLEIGPNAPIKSLVNDPAAEHPPIEIKDGELAGRDRLIGLGVNEANIFPFEKQSAGLIGLPVTELAPHRQRLLRLRPDPIHIVHQARVAVEMLIKVSMGDVKDVLLHVFLADEPSLVAFARDPADSQTLPLAEGVIEHPHMLAEDFAVIDIDDLAFRRKEVIVQELTEIPLD